MFLEKGNKSTSKFTEGFNRIKVELPPFLLLEFFQYPYMHSSVNSIQNLRIFYAQFRSQPNFFLANFATKYVLKDDY